MEDFTESIEYYYDEDFSIPFDIGISEENNNSHVNHGDNYFRYMDITYDDDNDQEDYDNDELERVMMPEHIFSQIKSLQNQFQKSPHLLRLKRSYEVNTKPVETRMSCSSSPNSISSIANNGDIYTRLYLDSFCHNNQSFNESAYSLKTRVPLFDRSNRNVLANYHLNFAPQESFIGSYNSKPLSKPYQIGTNVSDSGEYSVATLNITDDPIAFVKTLQQQSSPNLKPDSILWRQIKCMMLYHFAGWSLLTLFKHVRKKPIRNCSSTDDLVTCRVRNSSKRSNRYSCSVLELYNAVNDADRRLASLMKTKASPSIHNFSCQFPPKSCRRQNSKEQSTPTKIAPKSFEYPGIGRLMMPKQTRLNCSVFMSMDLNTQLSFLQTSLSNQSDTTYNRHVTGDKVSPSLKPCLLKRDDTPEPKVVALRQTSYKSIAATEIFKRKSVSFDCPRMSSENLVQEMKAIPRKWGLHGTEAKSSADMMAIFECGRRESLVGFTGGHESLVNDDTTRFREMVNNVLRALKQISDRLALSNQNNGDNNCAKDGQLNDMCDLISGGHGLDTPLATAIDNLITLLSDGLVVVTSFSSKKVRISNSTNKAAMRLWLLVEETCRISSTNTPRKTELSQIVRDIRQTVSAVSSNKDYHLRLRSFIANALKAGLMHVWLRYVVANDSALQRFYCAEAFLRQARTGQSDTLATLSMSLKTLSNNDQSSPKNRSIIIDKPLFPPPVKITRRQLPTTTQITNKLLQQPPPFYAEETTESESYVEESRSSQSECPPNRDISNNNSIFSRAATHPRFVKKSTSCPRPTFIDSIKSTPLRKPIKSLSSQVTRQTMVVVSIPMKTIRNQPLSLKK